MSACPLRESKANPVWASQTFTVLSELPLAKQVRRIILTGEGKTPRFPVGFSQFQHSEVKSAPDHGRAKNQRKTR